MRPSLRLNGHFTPRRCDPYCYVKVVLNGLEGIKILPGQGHINSPGSGLSLLTPAGRFNHRRPRCHPAYVSAVMSHLNGSPDWACFPIGRQGFHLLY